MKLRLPELSKLTRIETSDVDVYNTKGRKIGIAANFDRDFSFCDVILENRFYKSLNSSGANIDNMQLIPTIANNVIVKITFKVKL